MTKARESQVKAFLAAAHLEPDPAWSLGPADLGQIVLAGDKGPPVAEFYFRGSSYRLFFRGPVRTNWPTLPLTRDQLIDLARNIFDAELSGKAYTTRFTPSKGGIGLAKWVGDRELAHIAFLNTAGGVLCEAEVLPDTGQVVAASTAGPVEIR